MIYYSKQASRVAFAEPSTRKLINEFLATKERLATTLRLQLVNLPCIGPVFEWIISHFDLLTHNVSTVPRGIKRFLQCVGSPSPVSTYLFPSDENIGLVKTLCKKSITNDGIALRVLQSELPIFYGLTAAIKQVPVLPGCFQDLLDKLAVCASAPFNPLYRIPDSPVIEDSVLSL